MKTLLAVLVLGVAALAGVVEWGAPRVVADRVEQRVNADLGDVAAVEADAGTFPFVPRLVADGRVARLTMRLREVAGQEATFGSVAVELRGIQLDRQQLLDGEVAVTAIDAGTATVRVDQEALSALAGLLPGAADVSELAPGRTVPLPLPERLLPCTPVVRRAEDGARLSCDFDQVPSVLLQMAQ